MKLNLITNVCCGLQFLEKYAMALMVILVLDIPSHFLSKNWHLFVANILIRTVFPEMRYILLPKILTFSFLTRDKIFGN